MQKPTPSRFGRFAIVALFGAMVAVVALVAIVQLRRDFWQGMLSPSTSGENEDVDVRVAKFKLLLQRECVGPFHFEQSTGGKVLAEVFEKANHRLSSIGAEFGLSYVHAPSGLYFDKTLYTFDIPALPIARAFDVIAEKIECSVTNRYGYYEFKESRHAAGKTQSCRPAAKGARPSQSTTEYPEGREDGRFWDCRDWRSSAVDPWDPWDEWEVKPKCDSSALQLTGRLGPTATPGPMGPHDFPSRFHTPSHRSQQVQVTCSVHELHVPVVPWVLCVFGERALVPSVPQSPVVPIFLLVSRR